MHTLSGDAIECAGMDTLIIAQGHRPDTGIEAAMHSYGVPVILAGDCRSPRSAEEAVYEGMMAGRDV